MTKLIVDGAEIDFPPEYTLLQACEAAAVGIADRAPEPALVASE